MAELSCIGAVGSLCNIAWQVYKHCKDASESFLNISSEVLSLHAVLREAEETLSKYPISDSRLARLTTVVIGCRDVLTDLKALVDKYKKLDSKTQRVWHRVGWHMEDLAELRLRLTSNIGLLTAFMSTSQPAVEQKLNLLLREYQNGHRESSILSTQTVDSISPNEKETWRAIRKELEEIGISIEAFDSNKGFILEWFREALQRGDFQDQCDGAESDEAYHSDGSNDSTAPNMDFGPQKVPASKDEMQPPQTQNNPLKLASDTSLSQEAKSNPARNVSTRNPDSLLGRLARQVFRYDNAFCKACRAGNLERVEELIGKGASINSREPSRIRFYEDWIWKPFGSHGVIQEYESAHPDIYAIEIAITHRRQTIVQLLLDHGATVRPYTLCQAAYYSTVDILKAVIVTNFCIPINILMRAATEDGSIVKMDYLLSAGADVNGGDWFPLHWAAAHLEVEIVEYLLAKGADARLASSPGYLSPWIEYGRTQADWKQIPLWIVACQIPVREYTPRYKILKAVELLLKNGADPNQRGMMTRMAVEGDLGVARLLVSYGGMPTQEDLQDAIAIASRCIEKRETFIFLQAECERARLSQQVE